MGVTVRDLAELAQGKVLGDGALIITAARPFGEAQAGDITFLDDSKKPTHLSECAAAAVVVGPSVGANGKTLIQVEDPLKAFTLIVGHLHGLPPRPPHGIDAKAVIHPTVQIGPEASIHPFAVVEENTVIGARCRIHSGVVVGRHCHLGDDVILHPNCILYEGTIIGNRVIIHANAVIGADGFGYRFRQGRHVKIPQLGNVEVGDDVEIGACTTIDRATFGTTRIGAGTKLDNLVQIAHNCQIGRHNVFAAQVGLAGSCTTGDYVSAGGQVGVADHVEIGAGAMIGGKSGIIGRVPPKTRMFGYPAKPDIEQIRLLKLIERLPTICKDLKRMKKQLGWSEDE